MPGSEYNVRGNLRRLENENLHSREKVDLLNDVSFQLRISDPEKSVRYSIEAQELARQNDYKEGLAYGLMHSGISRIKLGDYDTSFDNLKDALEIFESTRNTGGLGNVLIHLGNLSQLNSNHTEALNFYERCAKLKKETGDREGEASLFNNTGFVYKILGDYKSALDFYLKAMEIYRELDDKNGQTVTLSNIGKLYLSLGEYDTAINYYEQVLSIKEDLIDKCGQVATLIDIAEACSEYNNYDGALGSLYKALELCWDIEDKKAASGLVQLIADVHIKCGNLDEALRCMNESLRLKRETGDKKGEISTLVNISSLYVLEENFGAAESTLCTAFKEIKNCGLTKMLPGLYKAWSVLYEFRKDFEESLIYYRKYRESLGNVSLSGNAGIVKEIFNNYFDFEYLGSVNAGNIELEIEEIDISALANSIAGSYAAKCEHSKVSVLFKSVPDVNIILADYEALRKVIGNIVLYAVKSSGAGKTVFIYLSGRDEKVRCEVIDESPAISMEARERIFSATVESVEAIMDGERNSLAALQLARILTEKMGGRFQCENFQSTGNVFILEFNKV